MTTYFFNAIRNFASRDARQARWLSKRLGLSGDRGPVAAYEPAHEPSPAFYAPLGRGLEAKTNDVDPAVFGLSAKRDWDVHLGFRNEITLRDFELALGQLG